MPPRRGFGAALGGRGPVIVQSAAWPGIDPSGGHKGAFGADRGPRTADRGSRGAAARAHGANGPCPAGKRGGLRRTARTKSRPDQAGRAGGLSGRDQAVAGFCRSGRANGQALGAVAVTLIPPHTCPGRASAPRPRYRSQAQSIALKSMRIGQSGDGGGKRSSQSSAARLPQPGHLAAGGPARSRTASHGPVR